MYRVQTFFGRPVNMRDFGHTHSVDFSIASGGSRLPELGAKGGESPPTGSTPVGGLGDKVPQKPKHFA